ncbi:hypothetical protein [Rodentibacter ratti]|uniref:Uncharacterized protein n=1 Tax=Rodentibacter ratti TaxID=1906745 RepID=A0A1V3LAL7_9PAST|nr:hypothetical protein [Rodentibacter ratti]OOF86919.1 hypothetical protein BKG88_02570 [Rodentibacter ratti]
MKKLSLITVILLTACSTYQPVEHSKPKETIGPIKIQKISLAQLCSDVENNQLRGEIFWKDKVVEIPVTVAKIGNTYDYSSFIQISKNTILAITARSPSDVDSLLSVSKGDNVKIIGTIDTIRIHEYQKDSYDRHIKADIGYQVEHPYCSVDLKRYQLSK